MKFVIVFALTVVAVAVAVPVEERVAQTLRADFEQNPDGSYISGFETDNGIKREEQGVLKEVLDEEKKPHTVVVVRGSYAYSVPGQPDETITYFADETGYHAEGPSVPKATRR